MVDAVKEYYSAVDGNDIDRLIELFTEDAVYYRPGYSAMHGHCELRRFYTGERVIASGEHHIDRIIRDGYERVVIGTLTGTLRDGSQTSVSFADHFIVNNYERIVQRCTYFYAATV